MKKAMKSLALVLTASAMLCTAGCINPAFVFDHADQYTAGDFSTDSAVKELDIDWTAGTVNVSHHNQPDITVTETCNVPLKDDLKVQTWLDGSTLHIRYCKSGINFNLKDAEKVLEVRLPEGMELETMNCDCTSAETSLADRTSAQMSPQAHCSSAAAPPTVSGSPPPPEILRLTRKANRNR